MDYPTKKVLVCPIKMGFPLQISFLKKRWRYISYIIYRRWDYTLSCFKKYGIKNEREVIK